MKKGKTISDFAQEVQCDRSYLGAISTGKKIPGKHLARAIEQATGGEVTAEELLSPKKDGEG